MLNLNKKTYLIIFSTLYVIGLMLGGFFQNMFYYFILNGIFTIGGLWSIYFLMDDKLDNDIKPKQVEHKQEKQKEIKFNNHLQITEPDTIKLVKPLKKIVPDESDEVYTCEEITEDELIQIKKENKSWYSIMNHQIKDNILEMKKRLNIEDEGIKNDNKKE